MYKITEWKNMDYIKNLEKKYIQKLEKENEKWNMYKIKKNMKYWNLEKKYIQKLRPKDLNMKWNIRSKIMKKLEKKKSTKLQNYNYKIEN